MPVLDASLVFTGRGSPASTDEQRVTGILGRVFPGLTVDTTPTISAEQATSLAAEASGGTTDGTARLVVLPTGTGVLAWEVVVVGATPEDMQAGRYYIDAHTGDLVDVRPVSAEVLPPVAHLGQGAAPDPNSVTVTGTDPLGRDLTAFGLQNGDRVELTDTTTDAWDAEQRTGAVQTYDASTVKQREPSCRAGSWTSPTTHDQRRGGDRRAGLQPQDRRLLRVPGPRLLGRRRRPAGQLGALRPRGLLQRVLRELPAPAADGLRQPVRPATGQQLNGTFVEPDIAAHEVTHGVTATTAGLSTPASPARSTRAFSDYFGNVIGNLIHGDDSVAMGEDACTGVPQSQLCVREPGRLPRRSATCSTATTSTTTCGSSRRASGCCCSSTTSQDNGGVHYNSAIWNNALWSIRTRLAQIDGQDGNTSELAHQFDRAVYGALATRLTPTSSFVDARAASSR